MARCKHREFDLGKGCPQCIEERKGETFTTAAPGPPEVDENYEAAKADQPTLTALTLRPGEDIVARRYHGEALGLLEYAEKRAIIAPEDLEAATDDLSQISKLKKLMDGKRKEYLAPLKAQTEAIRETYNFLMTPILEADKITRDKMLAYNAVQARIRLEQERINALKMEAAKAEMELKGELSESVNLVEVAPEAPITIRTDVGTASQKGNWKYEVTDFAALPDEYKVADSAMLNTIAKKHHDQKQVPGVRFYNEPIISMRAR